MQKLGVCILTCLISRNVVITLCMEELLDILIEVYELETDISLFIR